MGIKKAAKSLASFSKFTFDRVSSKEKTSCNLPDLPFELLHIIGSELVVQDLCSLSLVCRHLYHIYKSLKPFKLLDRPGDRRSLFTLLEKDLPDHLLCFSCDEIYRWRIPGNKHPQLCPHRATRPHFTYTYLNFEHHDRSVEREIIDLAYRHHFYGPKYGVPLSYLLERLQGKERLNKSLRMPAMSMLSACWEGKKLLVETEIEVRIRKGETSHPFAPYTKTLHPERWTEAPPSGPLVHGRWSSITRLLGCNVHDNRSREFSLGENGKYAQLYSCRDCETSVQVSVRKYKMGWSIVTLKTAQNMGGGREPYSKNNLIAGLSGSHRELMPHKKINAVRCVRRSNHSRELQGPPFCVPSPTDSQEDTIKSPNPDDLGLMAWFVRHNFNHQENVWPMQIGRITGYRIGYSRRKWLVPYLFWTLPIAFLWYVPTLVLWELPKIFVWDWPKETLTEYRTQRAAKKATRLAEKAASTEAQATSNDEGAEAAQVVCQS